MKNMDEIKAEASKALGYNDWYHAMMNRINRIEQINDLINEVCRRAQLECARETLKEAADKASIRSDWNHAHHEGTPYIDKNSILDEANIKLIQ